MFAAAEMRAGGDFERATEGTSARKDMRMLGHTLRGRTMWTSIGAAMLALAFGFSVLASGGAGARAQSVEPAAAVSSASTTPSAPPAPAAEQTQPTVTAPRGEPAVAVHLPKDLSPWGMFLNADIVVKAIMLGLVFASLVTWTVWLAKTIELMTAKRQAQRNIRILQDARTLAEAHQRLDSDRDPVARIVRAAVAEIQLSGRTDGEGLKERVAWLIERLQAAAARRIGRGMGILASIGATAPFVGLLGTVWGIMNSFIGISNAHTTNLAVVAPGIAEALLATAIGLFAAIPAVVIYNVFARWVGGYRAQLADAGVLVMRLLSRDAERGGVPISRAAE
jgi:biopolymer transport protein ExbB